jgi:hypothetical protein
MAGLAQIPRGIQVDIRGLGIHLPANVLRRRGRPTYRCAVVFIVLQQNFFIGAGDKVARDNWRNSGFRGLLAQILRKGRRKLAHAEGFFRHLF